MKIADEAQAKFDMLVNYRQDYSKSLKQSLETGIDAQSYQNFQGFFRKLDQAVKGQADMVEHAKQHVLAQQRVWKESQRKKLSYEVLLQRHDHKTNKVAQKKDQQMMDEFAMRSSRRSQ
jgi:flagellar FliJ protein